MKNEIVLTEVQVFPVRTSVPVGTVKASVNLVFNDGQWHVNHLRLTENDSGRLTLSLSRGNFSDIPYMVSEDMMAEMENKVLAAYRQAIVEDCNERIFAISELNF